MGRRLALYGTAMIITYLVVSHATGAGRFLTSAGSVGVAGVKAFQGR